jgi:hypothetical protein
MELVSRRVAVDRLHDGPSRSRRYGYGAAIRALSSSPLTENPICEAHEEPDEEIHPASRSGEDDDRDAGQQAGSFQFFSAPGRRRLFVAFWGAYGVPMIRFRRNHSFAAVLVGSPKNKTAKRNMIA